MTILIKTLAWQSARSGLQYSCVLPVKLHHLKLLPVLRHTVLRHINCPYLIVSFRRFLSCIMPDEES